VSKQSKQLIPDLLVEGNAKLPRSGAFEVTIDGKLVFSKFQRGTFPTEKDIKSWF